MSGGGNPYHDEKGRFTDGPSGGGGGGGGDAPHVVKQKRAAARGFRYLPEDKNGTELFQDDLVVTPDGKKGKITQISPAGTHVVVEDRRTGKHLGSYSASDVTASKLKNFEPGARGAPEKGSLSASKPAQYKRVKIKGVGNIQVRDWSKM